VIGVPSNQKYARKPWASLFINEIDDVDRAEHPIESAAGMISLNYH